MKTRSLLSLLWLAPLAAQQAVPQSVPATVEFNRDIRPILSDKCFTCHGPDSKNRMTKLRFDTEAGAKQDLGGHFAIVPGDTARSEMIHRITSTDAAKHMPPPYSGYKLTDREIAAITRWIEQGAKWQQHWAWIPPQRPALPKVQDASWPRNPIDYFVLERLEREGLKPAPEASRERLIRRVTLDLTGLPPTPAEIDAFLADRSPNAYEKVVDRLLASPRYGERMAAHWLDAARYADTNGYQTDAERFMWRWRDWVINAFNRNMPFNEFTIEQIAGDLLPHPTLDQIIATGFSRNHRGNGEGGIIPEEYQVEYVVDRVDTTATVFMGVTLGCARCHDHKYDPFKQKEFYQVFAYFNNIPEKGRAYKYGNSPPMIQAPTPQQQSELRDLERQLAAAHLQFTGIQPDLARAQRAWEKSLASAAPLPEDWSYSRDLVAHYALDSEPATAAAEPASAAEAEDVLLPEPKHPSETPAASQALPAAIWRSGQPEFVAGRIGRAASFDGKRYIDAGNVAAYGFYDKFTLAAWINPAAPTGAIITRAQDVTEPNGYGLVLQDGRVQLHLAARWLDDALRVETADPIELNHWHHVLATYDGSREAVGVRIYVDGRPQKLKVILDELNQSFATKEPLRIGAGGGPQNRFHGAIDDVRVYHEVLGPEDAALVAASTPVRDIAALAPARRSKPQTDKIRLAFLETAAPAPIQQAWRTLEDLEVKRARFVDSLPTVMVMQEMPQPRESHVLIRGAYDRPGERVYPGVPSILPPLPPGAPNNRLGLARWLVDPSNPLTARVMVNRFWQSYFGVGIVKTVEDFGSQGEWPSHPDLLDWLATEFIGSGWDMKAMQKLIVTSATYRQSSKVTPELEQRDPENRLLARGPRVRLGAGEIRDQALAMADLLVEKVGGPSVKPYQPAGLWEEVSGQKYQQDHGDNLYRRSVYTFWKRTIPPPSMLNFDAAGRETCVVRLTRTNTPLQALDLMNDVTYLEASRALAERMMKEGGASPEDRIAFAFRLATARRPSAQESRVLLDGFRYQLDNYQTSRDAAVKYLSQGEHKRDESLDPSELAAYTTVASLILNLDETVTKE